MKIILSFFLLFLGYGAAFAQIKVSGKIAGMSPGEKIYLEDIDLGEVLDSAATTDGLFSLKINHPVNKKYGLRINPQLIRFFWVEGKDVLIDAKADDFYADPVTDSKEFLNPIVSAGSTAQKEEDGFYAGNASLLRLIDTLSHPGELICDYSDPKLWIFVRKYYNSVNKTHKATPADFNEMIANDSRPYLLNNYPVIERRLQKAIRLLDKKRLQFAVAHPDSPVSSYFLTYYNSDHATSAYRDIKRAFNSLTLANRQSFYGQLAGDFVTYHRNLHVGDKFENILLKDTAANILPLASYKGKVVILEFWSTDCFSSFYDRDLLLPLYKKYHDQGLEIYTVSIDGSYTTWKAWVKKTNMPWADVWTPGGFFSQAGFTYNVGIGTPRFFIINRQGKIANQTWEAQTGLTETDKILQPLLKTDSR
ncbi:AhpC/TSA family protein [Mucilaginibacter sp. UR6-11]|uniref:AhpC/TSA family protein n=1 Tax=Mucilaginibacter sp. UR6-11 TaxID=1435644 RepID=UPI001E3AAAB9|nr:AhpC/TSA family protein [Mucilaginibacter sp. UR6-11]MCC8424103.1 AhpC/TSA family protein [Mucilaginibacter sp. UR6-11]